MDCKGLIENLKTHEMERKDREERDTKKQKSLAFKCSSSDNEDLDHEEDDEEKLSLLVKNIRRMFYKSGRLNSYRKGRKQGKEERKK